jgi:UDP-N-acetylmuramate--alanine ligase
MSFDFRDYQGKKVHFIGIGGVSMSGLAAVLLNNHIEVSGSDFKESPALDRLRKKGARIILGHHKENITDQDLVVYTAAIREDNEELMEARRRGVRTLDRAEFLGHLMKNFRNSIAVSGTHGKTSTTSMLSSIAMNSTMDPTILVGGELPLINGNFRIGNSDLFITEACEYKGSFLKFPAQTALILNVEADHLDYYRDLQHVLDTFKSYITLVPKDGTVVANADDPHMDYILEGAEPRVITFGINKGDLRAKDITYDAKGRGSFRAYLRGEFLVAVTLSVPGEFNILNALGAIGASLAAGIPLESIRKGLDAFSGVNKRFQLLFTEKEITVIDDYAHHPGEIRASLDTAKKMDYNHLHVVFQPHTYTRTKSLFGEFAESFDRVDNLVLLDIYAAREPDTGLVTSEELGDAIRERQTVNVVNMHTFEDAADYLMGVLEPRDIVITMGAGESVRVAELLKNRLTEA